jgi:hypothetical protein
MEEKAVKSKTIQQQKLLLRLKLKNYRNNRIAAGFQ